MFCDKCGTKIEIDANFCVDCGNRVSTMQDVNKLKSTVDNSDISDFHRLDEEKKDIVRNNYQVSNQNNAAKNQPEWYYESNGKRHGPVGPNKIKELIENNTLNSDTLIWNKEFDGWKKIIQTEFRNNFDEPPPLVGHKVDNNFIWLLAFSPIIGLIIELILVENSHIPSYEELFLGYMILNACLAAIDDIKLKNAGYKTNNFIWAIFLVPVYIWRRATLTKQSRAYFWVWIILMLINMTISLVIYAE